jgi:hypothetical protein
MKKLILLVFLTLSCSTPQVEDSNKIAQKEVFDLHIPIWMQGTYYRARALGGAPSSTIYRLYITNYSIRTEFDQTITSPFDPPIHNLIKTDYTEYLPSYYNNFKELYGTDIVGEFYKIYADEISTNRKNILIYHFWRRPNVQNTFCWRYPNDWEYWVKMKN